MSGRASRRQVLAAGMAAAGAAMFGGSLERMRMPAAAQGTKSDPKALVMAWGNDIKTMDPAMVTSSPDYNVTMQLYNGLVRYRPNSIDIEPDLALRWEVSTDGLTYTFYLRKGVKFHKGYGEMTAEDVKFSFERVVSTDLGSPYRQDMQLIKSVEVVNPYTVRLHLQRVNLDFLPGTLAYRPGYIVSKKAATESGGKFGQNPVGTGPYVFESRKPGEEAVFVAHGDYFRGKLVIDRVTLRVIPDETIAALALSRGEIGFMRVLTPEAFKMIRGNANLATIATPATGTLDIYMLPRGPLADVRVRQALSHAIDRDEYINKLVQGLAAPPSWSVLPPMVAGHTDGVVTYPYDPAKAKALLAAAGFPNGRGLRPLTLVAIDIYRSDAQAVQAYWSKIGVQVKIEELASAAARSRQVQGDLDMYFSAITRVVPSSFLDPLTSTYQPLLYGKIDDLITAQRAELDRTKRLDILRQIQQRVAEDVPMIPLYRPVQVTAFRKEITGNVANTFFWLYYWERMDIRH